MVGRKIAHYLVIKQLGAGGMGVVYLAHDETLDRGVALKVLPAGSLVDENARKRFRKEALALARLNHPNIETIYEFGSQDGVDFLVTEFVAGTTLAERIAGGPLPESEVWGIAGQIGAALEEAAANGLLHLDLKPRNMMLTPKGQIKLLDFGLARIVKPHETDATQSLTGVPVIAGTPPYMAPEQLLGGPLDVRTDIYAVGASLYELATGRLPFRGKTSAELIAAILQTPVPPPSSICPGLSPRLERVILKCLEKEPGQRYQTIPELLGDLALPATMAPTTPMEPPSRAAPILLSAKKWLRPWRLGISLGIAAAVILAVWLLGSRPALSFAARGWVLVTDFENHTNDPLFDQSLGTAFSVSLEQSRRANVYPRSRVRGVLARMKKDAGTKIDEAVGQEIAVREGIPVLILPSISGVGGNYRLAARIRDVVSGTEVTTAPVKAQGKQKILDSLDQLAAKVRGDLGESLLSISRKSLKLATVTTGSLEALKQYSIAIEEHTAGNFKDAKLYYENALDIDPTFTAARGSLGMIEFENFDKQKGKQLLSDAVRSVNNLTDMEKYGLLAFHAGAVEGNLEKAIGYHKRLIALYPDFAVGHNNLGMAYRELGSYPEAAAEFQECLRIDPQLKNAFWNLAYTDISLIGDLDAGIEACNRHIATTEPYYVPYGWRGYAYLAKGRPEEGEKDLRRAVELEPTLILPRFNLAVGYLLSGPPQSALDVLHGILAVNPQNCQAYYYIGLAEDSDGDRASARKAWLHSVDCRREFLKTHAKEAPDYLEIAIAQTRLGHAAEAQAAEETASSINPKLFFDTARLRSVQGRTGEALTLLERAEKSGLHDFSWVKLNPDLQPLSAQPRFAALLRRHLKGLDAAHLAAQ